MTGLCHSLVVSVRNIWTVWTQRGTDLTLRDENSLSDLKNVWLPVDEAWCPCRPSWSLCRDPWRVPGLRFGNHAASGGVFHGSHPQLLIKIDLRLINRVVPGNQSDGWRSPELRGKIEGERSASGVQSIKNITTVNLKRCSDSEDVIANISQLYSHYRAISCVDYYSNIR